MTVLETTVMREDGFSELEWGNLDRFAERARRCAHKRIVDGTSLLSTWARRKESEAKK